MSLLLLWLLLLLLPFASAAVVSDSIGNEALSLREPVATHTHTHINAKTCRSQLTFSTLRQQLLQLNIVVAAFVLCGATQIKPSNVLSSCQRANNHSVCACVVLLNMCATCIYNGSCNNNNKNYYSTIMPAITHLRKQKLLRGTLTTSNNNNKNHQLLVATT